MTASSSDSPTRIRRVLVTGSSGLIGSEAVTYFDRRGFAVTGVDNNMRRDFFGPDGDTTANLDHLRRGTRRFTHHSLDIRDRDAILKLLAELRPDLILHCASQPSHDLAKDRPFDDFEVNAVATLNLLEAARRHASEAPFVFMSTNKVYGDAPNERPLVEQETRWEYADPADWHGIAEDCRIDGSLHSLFGASKLAADVMVQEYGRYFGMPTCCLRCGCVTGPQHSGIELHGFLSYLVKCNVQGLEYRVFGYKGNQVRDNIHCRDVAAFVHAFAEHPRCGEIYNLGGGKGNSCSVLEAFAISERYSGRAQRYVYLDTPRLGDHICYYSDLTKVRAHYPGWDITVTVEQVIAEIVEAWRGRLVR